MDNAIDLHIHSIYSDGTDSPAQIVRHAKELGLKAISLTDHDCVCGCAEMVEECKKNDIAFVPGIEMSTCYNNDTEIHILGYYINYNCEVFNATLSEYVELRDKRTEKMVENLCNEGFNITMDMLHEKSPSSVITRAHIARFLYETGQITDQQEAFTKYIGDDKPCFVKRKKVCTLEAIKMIHDVGGIAVIAHPTLYHLDTKELDAMIKLFKANGLDGIEGEYSTYKNDDAANMKNLAYKYNLLLTGGSDYHGKNKPYIHLGSGRGNLHVPYKYYTELEKFHNKANN